MEDKNITIPVPFDQIQGVLHKPDQPIGLVIAPYPQHSLDFSYLYITELLRSHGLMCFSFDLLTLEESDDQQLRLNIELMTERLVAVTHFMESHRSTANLPQAYFGTKHQAAGVLRAAAGLQHQIKAVATVAAELAPVLTVLHQITAPTLLIAGEKNLANCKLNEQGFQKLTAIKKLEVMPGVSNFSKDPAHGNQASVLAVEWLKTHVQEVQSANQ